MTKEERTYIIEKLLELADDINEYLMSDLIPLEHYSEDIDKKIYAVISDITRRFPFE